MVHLCRHKRKILLEQQAFQRRDRHDDILCDSVESFVASTVHEEPQRKWLNSYTKRKGIIVKREKRRAHVPSVAPVLKSYPLMVTVSGHMKAVERPVRKTAIGGVSPRICPVHGAKPSVVASISRVSETNTPSPTSPLRSPAGRRNESESSLKEAVVSRSRSQTSFKSSSYDYLSGNRISKSAIAIKIGEFLKNTIQFLWEHPNVSYLLLVITSIYCLFLYLDSILPRIAETAVRSLWPMSRAVAVSVEQTGRWLGRISTQADELSEAFYCDFARMWCNRYSQMCDVRCNFLDVTLERIRRES